MKKILLFVLLLTAYQGFGQTASSARVRYTGQWLLCRDTASANLPGDSSAIIWQCKDSTMYIRFSITGPWKKFVTTSPSGGFLLTADTAAMLSGYVRLQRFQDSLTAIRGRIDGGGVLFTAAQPNITSVGTLTNLTVTNNIQAATLSSTITSPNQPFITTVGTLGNLTVTNNIQSATISSSITTANQPNITKLGTLTALTVSGIISSGALSSPFATLTGLTVQDADLTVRINDLGAPGQVFGSHVAQIVGAAYNDAHQLKATGKVQFGTITTNTNSFDGIVQVSAVGTSLGISFDRVLWRGYGTTGGMTIFPGNSIAPGGAVLQLAGKFQPEINNSYDIGTASLKWKDGYFEGNITGTLTTAAQPNVTSIGTLGALTVSGTTDLQNLYVNGNANMQAITATKITATSNMSTASVTFNGGQFTPMNGTFYNAASTANLNKQIRMGNSAGTLFTGLADGSGTSVFALTTDGMAFIGQDGNKHFGIATNGSIRADWDGSGNVVNTGTITGSSIIKSGGTSSQFLMADGSVTTVTGGVSSGSFTPTQTGSSTNVNSINFYKVEWTRVGNVVSFSGLAEVSPTVTSTNTNFYITIPVASTFTAATQGGGTGVDYSAQGLVMSLIPHATGGDLFVQCKPTSSTTTYTYTVQYKVL